MKPNKLKCIRDYCLSCAGDQAKEVTLCHLFDCPLWEYRTGAHVSSPIYRKRMMGAMENYREDLEEVAKLLGTDILPCFLPAPSKKPLDTAKNRPPMSPGAKKRLHMGRVEAGV